MLKQKIPGAVISLSAVLGSLLLIAGLWIPGTIVWVLGYSFLLFRQFHALRATRWRGRLNSQVATKIGFSFGIAGPIYQGSGSAELFSWIALTLTIFLLRLSSGINEFNRGLWFNVANLDPIHFPKTHPRWVLALTCALLILPPVLFLLAEFNAPGGFGLLVTGIALAICAVTMWKSLKRRQAGAQEFNKIPDAVEKLAPIFIVYWSAPRRSKYQLAMWIPFLKRIGLPFMIVVRSTESFREAVQAADGAPVIWAKTLADVERIMVGSISTVFYVNNSEKNNHVVRFSHLRHIQLLHGDSEKTPSYNPVTAMFDRIYVAGEAAINRYADHNVSIAPEKFEIVGRPQVEGVDIQAGSIIEKSNPVVLYAPTWSGFYQDTSYSSLLKAKPLIAELLALGCRVIFRPHPYSRTSPSLASAIDSIDALLSTERENTGVEHVFGGAATKDLTINECFNASDAMIADVSSVVSDFLYSRKPLGLFTGPASPEELLQELPLAGAAYIFGNDPNGWSATLRTMLHADPLQESRNRMREHYLGDLPDEGYSDVFVQAARRDILAASRQLGASEELVFSELTDR